MPITKVPVVHKFGIISHSQRLELQERLLKQTYLQSVKSKRMHVSQRNPLEVSEVFIQQFNNAETFDEKDRYEEMARKMLERAKRRAGVRNSGSGNHVNLPLAWTELAQIAQCKGQIQEECLDVLIVSLDVSPLAKYHIPALFFLAETMLYWLRTDAVHQPYLRTGEIKLLRMGQLVFQRLFYHHMAGQLQGHSDFKNRLFTYTDGLVECQEAYNPYPNVLLSMRFIIEVSKIILADAAVEPGEVKEGDDVPGAPKHDMEQLESATREMYRQEQRDTDGHSSHSGAISSSVHDLSPTLWHALDVWRCTNSLSGGFREALKALAHCGLGLASETWVDGIIALNILSETAKSNMAAMKVLHRLAQGVKVTEDLITPPLSSRSGHSDMFSISSSDDDMMHKHSDSRGSYLSSKPSLSDIYERSDEGDLDKKLGSSASANGLSSATNSFNVTDSNGSNQDALESQREEDEEDGDDSRPRPVLKESAGGLKLPLKSREVSFDEATIAKERTAEKSDLLKRQLQGSGVERPLRLSGNTQESNLSARSLTEDTVPGTGFLPDVGSDFFTSRGSDASSAPTFTNLPLPETPGINGWHWEVAFTYTDMLANICIHGNTASIQKMALVGTNLRLAEPQHRVITTIQLPSAGLLDLAAFHALNEATDGGPNDWSWRIRYGAIQGLVKVVRSLEGDKAREGLRTAAWNALLRSHTAEKDGRVLEALKVGQVHTDMQGILGKEPGEGQLAIGGRIASGLSLIYLPPLPPPVELPLPRMPHPVRSQTVGRPQMSQRSTQRDPLRTSLKEEIDLATSLYEPPVNYNTRTSFDLRRIVEDQWRKELQTKLDGDKEERRKELEKKQKEEEEQQRHREENKAKKLAANKPKRKTSSAKSSGVTSPK
ncbi:transmembrane protein 232-like [Littorina saxatilis]|uniref:Transmembrane protein 232 n=1 Tax=Littorina saxatilis TaxID=31220 RepID=A0AAN9B080_9CAEN